jgi:C4-dicarboxylate-specific signal transduction histidine kinase
MTAVISWLERIAGATPLPLLEVWGRFAYIVGLGLAICAFGRFTFRIGNHWGFGRERQTWDERAFLAIPLTFILIVVSGYAGSFVVLVEGAQTLESLKDLVVILCLVLFGYPALITVPFAYGLSDLIEGVPPAFLLGWLAGYFINPACFWVAYQLIGRDPDFRRARTWRRYLLAAAIFMSIEPVLWGFICSDQFTSAVSYRTVTPALFFTTAISWLLAPFAFLVALPLTRRLGWFWAEIPGHVRERAIGSSEWIWVSGRGEVGEKIEPAQEGLPIQAFIFAPFIALVLVMVGATAIVALRNADDDAAILATRLHEAVSETIDVRLDDYLRRSPVPIDAERKDALVSLLRSQDVGIDGRAFILDGTGKIVASSAPDGDAVVKNAMAALDRHAGWSGAVAAATEFQFDHLTKTPLSRETWLTRATPYRDDSADRRWTLVTAMPEASYLAGLRAANSRTALLFAVALVLSLLLAAALASMVTAPLRRMAHATQAMARGDLSTRVQGSKLVELDVLAKSFNDMAARLKKSFDDLVGEVEIRKTRERELEESQGRLSASEAEARERMLQVERMNRRAVAGELSASIAHEINQPLAAIVASANAGLRWLSNKPPDLDEVAASLKHIVNDGHRASDVISTVRAMVKQETQKKEPTDINDLINGVLDFLRAEFLRQDVTVRSVLAERLPSVWIDHVQLQQVVLNLIINAVDAMNAVPDRDSVLRIKTEANDAGDVLISIEDNGTGIDPANIGRMFEPFFTTKPQGMGMGLSICRSIVEAHGGTLTATPAADHGSVFKITLPTLEEEAA